MPSICTAKYIISLKDPLKLFNFFNFCDHLTGYFLKIYEIYFINFRQKRNKTLLVAAPGLQVGQMAHLHHLMQRDLPTACASLAQDVLHCYCCYSGKPAVNRMFKIYIPPCLYNNTSDAKQHIFILFIFCQCYILSVNMLPILQMHSFLNSAVLRLKRNE